MSKVKILHMKPTKSDCFGIKNFLNAENLKPFVRFSAVNIKS